MVKSANLSVRQDTPKLQYKPLKTPTSFRLLQLISEDGEDMLRCRMFEADLASADMPMFAAVSYTWQDDSLPRMTLPILVNDSHANVSPNLWNFLQTYRQAKGERILWIDQICINQEDLDERAQQVQQMCDIYGRAAADLFWIGELDEYTRMAFSLFTQLFNLEVDLREHKKPYPSMDDLSNPDYTASVGLPPFPSLPWEALCRTFLRPAFERAWILQELAVSRQPTVICGGLTIPFEVLGFASRLIGLTQWSTLLQGKYRMPGSARFLATMNNCRLRHGRGEKQALDMLLVSTRCFKSTNPADKIFALVNLAETGQGRQIPPLIAPDYRKSTADVFRDATLHCIQEGSLDVLSGKEDPCFSKRSDLPSWVPDYTMHLVTSILCHPPMKNLLTLYSAAASRPLIYRYYPQSPNILGLSVYAVDRIAKVAENEMSGDWIQAHLEDWAEMVDINNQDTPLAARCRSQYPYSPSPIVETFWRTLVGNTAFQPPEVPVPSSWARYFASLVRETREELHVLGDFKHKPEYSRVFFEGKSGRRSEWPAKTPALDALIEALPEPATSEVYGRTPRGSSYFFGSMHHVSWQRRLFITETGYLGLGPQSSRPGDIVALFSGGRMPFIIRPPEESTDHLGDQYCTMLGDSYVHGIMDGELMSITQDEDWQDLDFH